MSQQVAITLFLKKGHLIDLKLCLTFHNNIIGKSQHQVLFFSGRACATAWSDGWASREHTDTEPATASLAGASLG